MSAPRDAALVASLFAVDPAAAGGVCLRSPVHPARDQWLALLRDQLPEAAPWRRIPCNIGDGRLLGGLDLAATLKSNRPVAQRGVLAEAHGGVVIVAMAERLASGTAARLCAVLDAGEVTMPREGVVLSSPAALGVVALDEGWGDEERVPAALLDRLGFLLDLESFDVRTMLEPVYERAEIEAARRLLPRVVIADALLEALCATAMALGAGSPRVSMLAAHAARVAAALEGRTAVSEADAVLAGRLVLAPRATSSPAPPDAEQSAAPPEPPPNPPPGEPPPDEPPDDAAVPPQIDPAMLQEMILAAVQAAIPAGLLARLRSEAASRVARSGSGGKSGAQRRGGARGRPSGVSIGAPRGDARLNVIETLRAAAPWQRLRGRGAAGGERVRVSPDDFRVTRYKRRTQTLTIFAVDASGSAALHRLAEAKGAVELLLADCYVRRDQVAVIAFRGKSAELLLPPTRSLVRAKRSLAGLPGGGGTPLAAAIDAAAGLAVQAQRRGETPTLIILSDGRANVSRDGAAGRETAHAQALKAARVVAAAGITALFIDTSPRPHGLASDLAAQMRARYLALPFANARALNDIVRAAAAPKGA